MNRPILQILFCQTVYLSTIYNQPIHLCEFSCIFEKKNGPINNNWFLLGTIKREIKTKTTVVQFEAWLEAVRF